MWTELLIGFCCCMSIVAGQQLPGDTSEQIQRLDNVTKELDRRLQAETTARLVIENELQQKNDLIQFLQTDVTSLNATLFQERNARVAQDAKIRDLQQKLANLQSTVSENTGPTAPPEVAFSASRPRQGHGVFVPHFDHVTTNIGSSFNPALSLFTCPTDGLYMFTATLQKNPADISIKCWIRRNGSQLAFIEVHDEYPGNPTTATNTVLVQLRTGDQVELGMCSGDADFVPEGTTFSGALL